MNLMQIVFSRRSQIQIDTQYITESHFTTPKIGLGS